MKIKEIQIKKFRNLSDIKIEFAPGLNGIAGQNGTSKTSLLGLVGHIFNFNKKYKTLLGKSFHTEVSEIFRFAYPDYDKAGEHQWIVEFDNGKKSSAVSYDRIEKDKKKNIRIRVGKSSKGEGKINFPVIYLGMGRLFPLTLEKEITNNDSSLSEYESNHFSDLHNEILLIDEVVTPESITSVNKSFYAPKTELYNHLGNSAGQDNIGQIISALISFKRLQKDLGNKYIGGILLIDELDASLFPAAQIQLIKKLNQKAKELKLQIFFTTHSLEILSEVKKFPDSQVIFLDKSHGRIKPVYDLDIEELKENLLVLGPEALKHVKKKKYVYVEDKEAVDMLKNILTKEIKSNISVFATKLGQNVLKDIAKKKIPDFKNSVIVLDGDTNNGQISNVICLPGLYGPDRLIYELLKEIPASHDLWKKKRAYDKQFCFKNLSNIETSTDDSRKRIKIKNWYKEQSKYWGVNNGLVWKMWILENKNVVERFINEFKKKITS